MKRLAFSAWASIYRRIATRHASDDQIVGTWKSNKALTIPTIQYPSGATPEAIQKLQEIFGLIVMTYGTTKARAVMPPIHGFPEWIDESEYIITGRSLGSITIQFHNTTENRIKTVKVNFESRDRYWIDLGKIQGREYFDKIGPK